MRYFLFFFHGLYKVHYAKICYKNIHTCRKCSFYIWALLKFVVMHVLYSKRLDRIIEIENFFSPEELNRVNARGQKVPPHISDSLEGEITGDELEKSLKSSNMNSCPGWDGVAYKLLKKTWEFVKTPICNMANKGFNQGLLSPTLRTGLIKLIPKGKTIRGLRIGDQ
jgi:hypothetical protein